MSQDREPRRRFIRQVLAIVPATTLATGLGVAQSGCSTGTAASNYSPNYFTADEWTFIKAAVDRLIPHDRYGAGALEADVPVFIDRQMDTPYGHGKHWYMQGPFYPDVGPLFGLQVNLTPRQIYRYGIAECNNWCRKQLGKVFAELDKITQENILSDLQHGRIELETAPAMTFFSFLLNNAKEGYFADPIYGGNKDMVGWKMVGFPGARADFMDWVDQPNVKYPYGPVSIAGQRG